MHGRLLWNERGFNIHKYVITGANIYNETSVSFTMVQIS